MVSVWVSKMYYLACLLRLRHPEGPSSDPGTLWNTKRKTLGSRLGLLLISDGFRDHSLGVFAQPWNQKYVLAMRVYRSRFVMNSGSEAGCLGFQNQVFSMRGVAKINFSHRLGLHWFRCHFHILLVASGPIFMTFGALETDWNLMIFDGFPGGLGAEQPWPDRGNLVAFWTLLE